MNKGLSVIELLIVLVIFGIIAGIGLPNFDNYKKNSK